MNRYPPPTREYDLRGEPEQDFAEPAPPPEPRAVPLPTIGRVFVSQIDTGRDMSSAIALGYQPVPIFKPNHSTSFKPEESYAIVLEALFNFDPNTDALAFTGGDPMSGFLMGAAVRAVVGDQPVKWLRWERAGRDSRNVGYYVPIMVSLLDAPAGRG